MPTLTPTQQNDLTIIRKLLNAISAFLHWIVSDSVFVPAELRQQFLEVFPLESSSV